MSRRMLSHRAIQKCARLTFGISVLEMPNPINESRKATIKEWKYTRMKLLPTSLAGILKENLSC